MDESINLEIYIDLSRHKWFTKVYPSPESFNYESFDTGANYFKYLKLKNLIDEDYVLLKKSKLSIFIRLAWFIFWMFAIYVSINWSGWITYFLSISVLSGYLIILGKGLWKNESLKLCKEGCEVNETTKIMWKDISTFVTVPYRLDDKYNYTIYGCIVLKNGILFKIPVSNYLFGNRNQKMLLPVHVEYFKEKSEQIE